METTRRRFLKAVAIAPMLAGAVAAPMEVVRATTDMDFTATSLLYAMGVVGKGPYTLRVAPEGYGYARRVLSRAFGDPERYRDFTIKVERLDDYIDSWALDNGRRQFYTIGA